MAPTASSGHRPSPERLRSFDGLLDGLGVPWTPVRPAGDPRSITRIDPTARGGLPVGFMAGSNVAGRRLRTGGQ